MSLIGATGSGKTTLAQVLLPLPQWVVVFACKAKDDTMNKLIRQGYRRIENWPPSPFDKRVVLWPKIDRMDQKIGQHIAFVEAIDAVYRAGGWAVYADELGYMTRDLGMGRHFDALWQQGRSLGITLIASMQRPRNVSLNAYTQATHIFFWRQNDEADLKRIAGIGWVNSRTIRDTVCNLNGPPNAGWSRRECSEFLYVNTRSGRLMVSRVDNAK